MRRINFILSRVEHERSYITSGPDLFNQGFQVNPLYNELFHLVLFNKLKSVLGGVRIFALSISSHEQTQLNRFSLLFSYIVGFLYF